MTHAADGEQSQDQDLRAFKTCVKCETYRQKEHRKHGQVSSFVQLNLSIDIAINNRTIKKTQTF